MDRPQKTLADFVAIAISPLLIMALVGSLVFFLLEVIYVGRYAGSLQYTLFFFVFGAVLVARISMQAGIADRAMLYGLVLGLATWLALLRFVDYPEDSPLAPWSWAINLGLIVLIWWCAHRLIWDCTLIDDDVDASGSGLLESAGLEKASAGRVPEPEQALKRKKGESGLIGWIQRYDRYREDRRKKPHTPGVWVVYFSLAALPLFGLGQSQIPPTEAARRAYTFQLMCVYVGSGLGLLLTTSFLGLRRYLRQRNLRMPAAITSAWLGLGGLLIVAMLIVGAIVPRPADPNPLLDWVGLGSKERGASPFAQVGQGKEKRKDEQAARTEPGEGKDKEDGKGSGGKDGKGPADKNGKGRDKAAKDGNGSKQPQKDGERSKEGEKDKDGNQKESSAGKNQEKGAEKKAKDQATARGQNSPQRDKDGQRQAKDGTLASSSGSFMGQLPAIVKWIVIGIIILLIAFFILRAGLTFLANFTDWARRLLAGLQAWWQGIGALFRFRGSAERAPDVRQPVAPPVPFSSYPDPFTTGRAGRMSPGELVRYSFEALEAWAREQHLERHEQETPLEFAQRLGDEVPTLEDDARRLAGLYASLAYARGNLPESCREAVRGVWRELAGRAPRPISSAMRR